MIKNQCPSLIVFSGLPGTGKTTVSKAVAAKLCAIYLRIDTIEQALKAAGAEEIGWAGYAVANALAQTNLLLGHIVVVDCVNPVRESRIGWRNVSAQASARLIDIQLICSDATEHKRRVEGRSADIPGHILPTWESVMRHEFEARDDDYLLLDTATLSPEDLVNRCEAYVSGKMNDQLFEVTDQPAASV